MARPVIHMVDIRTSKIILGISRYKEVVEEDVRILKVHNWKSVAKSRKKWRDGNAIVYPTIVVELMKKKKSVYKTWD